MRTGLVRLRERITGRDMKILTEKISQGGQLGDAFAAAGFSPFESNLVTAGERSAQLDSVFEHLADFWSRQRQMYQAMTSQLYYPCAIFIFALLTTALVESVMVSTSVAVIHLIETLALYGGIAFTIYTLIRVSWSSDAAQRFWLAVPIIGRTLSTAYAYRWVTALRLEHAAGIPMPDAVADAWRASGYAGRESLAREGHDELREGAELSTLVQRWKRLPRDWVDFIETGEVSGALETAFTNLQIEASAAWDIAQKQMTMWVPKIIYFIAILVVGAQVFSLAYKMVAGPMNELNSALNGIAP